MADSYPMCGMGREPDLNLPDLASFKNAVEEQLK